MTFWERYVRLCMEKGKSPNGVAKELGLSSGSVTAWKNGKTPHSTTLHKIADYFGVTVNYLLGKTEQKEKLPESNEEFIEMVRQLNKTKGQAFFCGANGKVIDVPPEAESLILNLIETLDKNKK